MARVTSDVGSVLIFLSSGFLQLVTDLILAVGIAALLLWVQWRLALVAFVALPVYALNHELFSATLHRLAREVRGQVAAIYALLGERVSAVRVVRSFAKEDAEVAALDRRIDAHRDLSLDYLRAGTLQAALATLISGAGTVLVVSYGALLVTHGSLTVGELLAFYALVAQLYNPIVRLTQFHATAAATLVSIERMYEILDEPEGVPERPGALAVDHPRGALSYRGVSFAYTPEGPPVLCDIDLDVEPGTTVGVLGASGSGKSTLLALAPRLYDLPEGAGSVLLDGRDVRGLRLTDLRRAVVLVTQQPILFEGTIRSNLTYAAPGAGRDAIRRALEASDLAATVATLPAGLDTPVGERGLTLSGGQRQRLALARALLADPTVLLLDDCTSALDAETEARVQAALCELLPGRTRLIVSHKVASVRNTDRIVVLDAGRIVERGTHEGLLALGGRYTETYHLQTNALTTY
jgi:ABC-type multidrug transport system fused ATPase/permease subunit